MSQVPGAKNADYTPKVPAVGDDLAAFLEANYPAICWNPSTQYDWQHHRYAGMYELAQYLIDANRQQKTDLGLEPGAEHARSPE